MFKILTADEEASKRKLVERVEGKHVRLYTREYIKTINQIDLIINDVNKKCKSHDRMLKKDL